MLLMSLKFVLEIQNELHLLRERRKKNVSSHSRRLVGNTCSFFARNQQKQDSSNEDLVIVITSEFVLIMDFVHQKFQPSRYLSSARQCCVSICRIPSSVVQCRRLRTKIGIRVLFISNVSKFFLSLIYTKRIPKKK